MFDNKKIFIFGLARSGYEVAKLLAKHNNTILVVDRDDSDKGKISELESLGISFVKSDNPEDYLDDSYDYVVKNPGIIKTHPCVLKAHSLNIDVINEVEVAYHFIKDKVKIIGITGSNGKTTTTTMIYDVMKKASLPVFLAGNIGYPLSSIVEQVNDGDIVVMEVSDHQLLDVKDFKTDISVMTNLSVAHIDFHGSYLNYINTKKKIFNHHTLDDIAILNFDNKDVLDISKDIDSRKIYFSSKRDTDLCIIDDFICYKDEKIVNIKNIKLQGLHNYENIMCMIGVVKEFNVSNEIICSYLKDFGGVEHRNEFVREFNGRKFYNDSKATNTESTITALKSFSDPVILLLGGLERGHSFEPLNPYLKNVSHIYAFGETKERIKKWAQGLNIDCDIFDNLKGAFDKACEASKPGDIILLSPSCASWDQYKCMEERGEEFKKFVNDLK